jgi:hypothetical protein
MPARISAAQYAALTSPSRKPKRQREKKASGSEAALLKQVLAWLTHKGVRHWRANAGAGLRHGKGGKLIPVRSNPAGTSDILAVVPVLAADGRTVGRLVGIEAKAPDGRLRESQLAWKENMEAVGVLYVVARSLQDVIDAFAKEGIR